MNKMPVDNDQAPEICACDSENVIPDSDNNTESVVNDDVENQGKEKSREKSKNVDEKTNNKSFKDLGLEMQASRKYSSPNRHKSKFTRTNTWVQFQGSDMGYAYGGADPLNYEPTTKNRFIRRVFTILLILYLLTAAKNFGSAFTDLQSFYQEKSVLLIVVPVAFILLSLNYFMAYSECTRNPPFTYICLFLTFIATCIVSGFFSGKFKTFLVTYVYITMMFVSIACIITANTSFDFTSWLLYIITVGVALPISLIFFTLSYFLVLERLREEYPLYVLILVVLGTLINVLIMTGMLQIILSSEFVEIREDDYTLGAFYLYTSFFDIFLKVFQMLGLCVRGGGEDD